MTFNGLIAMANPSTFFVNQKRGTELSCARVRTPNSKINNIPGMFLQEEQIGINRLPSTKLRLRGTGCG
jgi:hypothetical protein